MFTLCADFSPRGDQPRAIEALVEGLEAGSHAQVLLGITGSGKTFTIANVIERLHRPVLVIAHNKTLAAQLYQEFKQFFPHNAVEYFVSYYDYYQPEAYIARTDTYIEKDMAINDRIDRLRLSATRSLLERRDVIIVASVSCIYGLGMPEYFRDMNLTVAVGDVMSREDIIMSLIGMNYIRNDIDFSRKSFRVRGDIIDVFPSYEEALGVRISLFGDEVEKIIDMDPLTGAALSERECVTIYPASHHVVPEDIQEEAIDGIKKELEECMESFERQGRFVERQRIAERTMNDIEMIRETGFCKGIENYSRHFSRREKGAPASSLLDYFPDDFITIIDESHQTLPQVHAMFGGDRSRKQSLVGYGFRLPSAYDNRPLKFEEFDAKVLQRIYVSATPGSWECADSHGAVVQQILRPTGLLDPEIEVRPATGQVDDVLDEIRCHAEQGGRVLVTTLTKRLAEELTRYLKELGVKVHYLHSGVDTLERIQTISDLRKGIYDVIVGINLLREGLDIPEVSLVAILDADKEGFLRSETALIQTCGRAARNSEGRVIMYADRMTRSIERTIEVTQTRRETQRRYNEAHGIVPTTVVRDMGNILEKEVEEVEALADKQNPQSSNHHHLTPKEVEGQIEKYRLLMKEAATNFQFEDAARFRDRMRAYEAVSIALS